MDMVSYKELAFLHIFKAVFSNFIFGSWYSIDLMIY